jgi:hypothetical protein
VDQVAIGAEHLVGVAVIGLTVLLSFVWQRRSTWVGTWLHTGRSRLRRRGRGHERAVRRAVRPVRGGCDCGTRGDREYATGTMRSTLTAVPRRATVLAAGPLVALCHRGLVASLATFLVSQPILRQRIRAGAGYPFASLADEPVRAVAGSGLYLALVRLLSLGVG